MPRYSTTNIRGPPLELIYICRNPRRFGTGRLKSGSRRGRQTIPGPEIAQQRDVRARGVLAVRQELRVSLALASASEDNKLFTIQYHELRNDFNADSIDERHIFCRVVARRISRT